MDSGVYVTGVGIISPAGIGAEANWRGLVGGRRFIEAVNEPGITGGPQIAGRGVMCAGRVRAFEPPAGAAAWDRVSQLAVAAADEAAIAADLQGRFCRPADPTRLRVSFGTSKGGIISFGRAAEAWRSVLNSSYKTCEEGKASFKIQKYIELMRSSSGYKAGKKNYLSDTPNRSHKLELLLSEAPPDVPARRLAARFKAAGAHATVAACSSGTLAVVRGIQDILDGQADIILAGSADASLHPLWFAAFSRMGVLAEPHHDRGPDWACRPFDRTRGGFAISEGAAVLVFESGRSVRRRGIEPLARLSGYTMGSDPTGLAQLQHDGAPLAQVVKIACDRAGTAPSQICGIQAHGTGTPANDPIEINAFRSLCGQSLVDIPIVSFKGALGHLLGAAGSVELALCVLGVQRRLLPPNATLIEPDAAWSELCLPRSAVAIPHGPILKTSLGFGGHLAAVLIEPV